MIGFLPTSLFANGREYKINTDFRVALTIFTAYEDTELSEYEKTLVMLNCLFEDFNSILQEDLEEISKQGVWFLDGGKNYEKTTSKVKQFDWEQDEQMIFSAVNKIANKETRSVDYLHWWTFLGYFSEIDECLFSTVLGIRKKKADGKKLEKYEKEFYRDNVGLIDLKKKYSSEEKEEMEYLNSLLNS